MAIIEVLFLVPKINLKVLVLSTNTNLVKFPEDTDQLLIKKSVCVFSTQTNQYLTFLNI